MYRETFECEVYETEQTVENNEKLISIISAQLYVKNWGRFYVKLTSRDTDIFTLGINCSPISIILDGCVRQVTLRCDHPISKSCTKNFACGAETMLSTATYECKLYQAGVADTSHIYEFLIPNANINEIEEWCNICKFGKKNIIHNHEEISFNLGGNKWVFRSLISNGDEYYLSDFSPNEIKHSDVSHHNVLQLITPHISTEEATLEARKICTILNLALGKLLHPLLLSLRDTTGKRYPLSGFCYAIPKEKSLPFVHQQCPGDTCIIDFLQNAYPIATNDWQWWQTTLTLYGTMGEAKSPITQDIINCIFIERIFNYISSKKRGEKNKNSRMPEFEEEMRTLLKRHFPTWDESRIKGAITSVKLIERKKLSYAEQVTYLEKEFGYEAPKQKISQIRNNYFHRGQSNHSEEEGNFTFEFITYITKILLKMVDYSGKTTKFWHYKIQ